MPAKEYSFEDRARAQELYLGGLNFAQVANITGVSESQLKRWSAEEEPDWPDQRRELRRDLAQIQRNTITLRKELLRRGLTILQQEGQVGPQDLYAATAIANLFKGAARAETGSQAGTVPLSGEVRVIKTRQDAVAAVEEVMQRHLNEMLLIPGKLTSQGLKDLLKVMEQVEELKARYLPAQETEVGETPVEGEAHRRLVAEVDKILGVK